jgi:hypothetical protein
MSKIEMYRQTLHTLDEWEPFLLKESGLPGPRGNIELAQAVADEGTRELFERFLQCTADRAPVNSPYEFLAFCGVVGLGRLVAQGETQWLPIIRQHASDVRWRMREGVAMALQRVGDADMDLLLKEMKLWAKGNLLEQRAAAAALCEPRLLTKPAQVKSVLRILDQITGAVARAKDRKTSEFDALRKGLGYCWSVAVAALPAAGEPLMEKWFASTDKDVQWIMRENLKKNRLARADNKWVTKWRAKLEK